MRRLIRSFAVVAAVAAMSVPVFGATHKAAACSQGATVSTTGGEVCIYQLGPGGAGFDVFSSPLIGVFGSATFDELQQTAEPTATQTITTAGSLSFTILDRRGNNQGFTAYLSCATDPCLTNPDQSNLGIPAADITVAGQTTGYSVDLLGDGVGPGIGVDSTGENLIPASPNFGDFGAEVGGQCRSDVIGYGLYNFNVPLQLALGPLYNEIVTLPISYDGNFAVSVVENEQPVGCPLAPTGPGGYSSWITAPQGLVPLNTAGHGHF